MKHLLVTLIGFSFLFLPLSGQNFPFSSDSLGPTDTDSAKVSRNEFSFHVLPIYQIFTGGSAKSSVLFQFKRKLKFRNAAITAGLLFQETSQDYLGQLQAVTADSMNLTSINQTFNYVGGMLGYEGFTFLNDNWKIYYGASILYLFGREVKQNSYSYYRRDAQDPAIFNRVSHDSIYPGVDFYHATIHRPGISLYGGMEYQITHNFGLSLMAMNNVYYDISRQTMPEKKALPDKVSFDLLRIFLMVKVYF